MAIQQNLPGADNDELFNQAFNWEPKYSNRFIMYIDNIPSYLIKAAARPSMTNGEIVLDHMNIDRKVKGKSRWNDISITLYDPIVPSGAQAVMDWVRKHHESLTGRDGYSADYKQNITFNSLSPTGEFIEEWTLVGAFILDTNFGSMDWSNEEAVTIEMTLKYDYAVLQY
tara:strand:+ start:2264 stop:2773 length:510 start_codon:yes stop_codon:yes gene_type:complete